MSRRTWSLIYAHTVAAAHHVILNTWYVHKSLTWRISETKKPLKRYVNSFDVFQPYYTTSLSLPPSSIAWIGSIQVLLLVFIGTFTGRLTDAGYFRSVFLLGTIFQVVGIFTTSVCKTYWQLFFAQGVCMGIGNGGLYSLALSTVSTYFSKRQAIAIGWSDFSGNGEAVVTTRWIRIDNSGYWVRAAVWSNVGKPGVEDERAAEKDRGDSRVGGVQGA